MVDNKNAYYFDKRTKPNSIMSFNVKDEEKSEAIKALLDSKNIVYGFSNKYNDFSLTFDEQFIVDNSKTLIEIHHIRYKEFSNEEP